MFANRQSIYIHQIVDIENENENDFDHKSIIYSLTINELKQHYEINFLHRCVKLSTIFLKFHRHNMIFYVINQWNNSQLHKLMSCFSNNIEVTMKTKKPKINQTTLNCVMECKVHECL